MRVAVTSRSFSRHPVLRAELEARYPHVTYNDGDATLRGESLVAFLKSHNKAIVALDRVDGALLDQVPELRVIAKYGVGTDGIDQAALASRGVRFGWAGGVNRRSVSELVIAMMISLLRGVPQVSGDLRNKAWKPSIGRQLSDRTIGIVGCGFVGKDLAVLLRAFGCRVLANDILDISEFCARHGVESTTLDRLLAESDIVTLHVPLDDTTHNLFDAQRLNQMKAGALLINAARGGIVEEAELKARLTDGRLGGAGFDVFVAEPPSDWTLFELPNFLATPHIGGSAAEAVLAMGRAAIDGLDNAQVPL
jgi:phosphoglycerate dehydrogenase-like enzyme